MTLILALLSLATTARAACDMPTTRTELTEQVQLARAAFAADDRPVLQAAAHDTRWVLGCLAEPVSSRDVALVHLVVGLERWDPDHPEAAVPWLHRYAVAFPAPDDARDRLPAGLTEAERPVFAQAEPLILAFEVHSGIRVPPPFPGRIYVDGDPTQRHAPANAPYVFQRMAGRKVIQTSLVEPGQERLPYPRVRPMMLGTGVALAGASVALFLGAARVESDLDAWQPGDGTGNKATEEQYFQARANLNHGLFIAGTATAALGGSSLVGYGLSFVF